MSAVHPRGRGKHQPRTNFSGATIKFRTGRLSQQQAYLRLSPFHDLPSVNSSCGSFRRSSQSLSLRNSISRIGWAVSFSATDDSSQKSFRPTEHGIMLRALEVM